MNVKITKDIRLWGNFYGFIIQGMIVTSFGTIMPYIRKSFDMSYIQGGLVLSVLAAGNLIFGFLSGVLSDFIGRKRVILLGNLFYIAGLALIVLSSGTALLYVGVLITGAGWGTCNTGINMLINQIVSGDGKVLNFLHMTYGIGAFIIPVLAGTLIRAGLPWKGILVLLMALAALALLFAMKMPSAPKAANPDTGKAVQGVSRTVFSAPSLYIFMLMAFFYEGTENAVSGWIVTYLMSRGFSETFSQNMLSAFWIAMICGRGLSGIISRRVRKPVIIMLSTAGALAAAVLFITVTTAIAVAVTVVLLGMMLSGIYPLVIACAHSIMSASGTAGAMITSTGGLGASVVPFAGGRAAQSLGTFGMIASAVISLLLLAAVSAMNLHAQGASQRQKPMSAEIPDCLRWHNG